MARAVRVERADPRDLGFATRFGLSALASKDLADFEVFAPGIWYRHNDNTVAGALANRDDLAKLGHFYFREMRMPLPLFMLRSAESGEHLTLVHEDAPRASSGVDEFSGEWLVDASIRYAALGLRREPTPTVEVVYPASEGERTYVAGNRIGWARRSHP